MLTHTRVWVLVALLLAGCGGGGGGGDSNSSSPSPPPTENPSSYSLAVSVAGLSGSGLGLIVNDGSPVSVSKNGSTTVASDLASGASYSVTIDTQPVNPVQTCTVTGGSGTVGSSSITVTVACAAAAGSTVNAAEATVTIDPSLPASATSKIASIVSPLDSQSSGSPLYIPVSASGGETMVFAVDANANIMLAALTTTTTTTLSVDSTALALTRLEIGALPPTVTGSQVNAAIEATADYSNLTSLISTSLAAGTSPATSTDVFASISAVLSELPSSLLTALSQASSSGVHAHQQPVATPEITPTPSPYPLLNTYAAGNIIGSVSVTGPTASGGVTVANTTAITWAVASATTEREPLPQGCTTSQSNPDCSVLVGPTSLFQYVIGTQSTVDLAGNAEAFNVYIEQTTASRTANVVKVGTDSVVLILNIVSAGEVNAVVPVSSCASSLVQTILPADQVANLVTQASGAAFVAYLKSVFSVSNGWNLWQSFSKCSNVGIPNLPKGANPVGPPTFSGAFTEFLTGLANYALNIFAGGAVGAVNSVGAAAGLPLEIAETAEYWGWPSQSFGVCEGSSTDSAPPQIIDCAASLAFNPKVLTLAPTGSWTPTIIALDTSGNATLTPPDLDYESPADGTVVTLDPDTGKVTALPLPGGTTSAQATVTVTDETTGINGTYNVTVSSVPTMTLTPNPTTLPASGGTVTLAAMMGPPQGAIGGGPAFTGVVTFTDQSGATLCTSVAVSSAQAQCTANITSVPDTITATYTDPTNVYGSSSGSATVQAQSIGTTTRVTANPMYVLSGGGSVTLTAFVSVSSLSGTSPPTGTVVFTDGTTELCSNVPVASTGAPCAASVMPGDTITASYSGDANYAASSGKVMMPTIGSYQYTYTGLPFTACEGGSSSNPCPSGPITMTATFALPAGYSGQVSVTTLDRNAPLVPPLTGLSIAVAGDPSLPAFGPGDQLNLSYFTFENGNIVAWSITAFYPNPGLGNPSVESFGPPLDSGLDFADYAATCVPAECEIIGSTQAYNSVSGSWSAGVQVQ